MIIDTESAYALTDENGAISLSLIPGNYNVWLDSILEAQVTVPDSIDTIDLSTITTNFNVPVVPGVVNIVGETTRAVAAEASLLSALNAAIARITTLEAEVLALETAAVSSDQQIRGGLPGVPLPPVIPVDPGTIA